MEDLTNTQLMLLVLLITFVTSIATGVITFSLLSEAPAAVTQTINRVVERTIEKVVPTDTNNNSQTKTTTVIVSDDDMIVGGADKLVKSVVRVRANLNSPQSNVFYGIGVVANKSGTIVVSTNPLVTGIGDYSAVFSDGVTRKISQIALPNEKYGLLFFKVVKEASDKYQFQPVNFTRDDLKLGQSIVSISGEERNIVSVSRVSDLMAERSSSTTTTDKIITSIQTIPSAENNTIGAPIVNLSGDFSGMRVFATDSIKTGFYLPSALIKNEISLAEASIK